MFMVVSCMSILGAAVSSNSQLDDVPHEIIGKIANDYASNQDLFHMLNVDKRFRENAQRAVRLRIEKEYFALSSSAITTSEIVRNFHYLGNNLPLWKVIHRSIALKSELCMFRGDVRDIHRDIFPFLAFVMKNSLQPSENAVFIYMFKGGELFHCMRLYLTRNAPIPTPFSEFQAPPRGCRKDDQNYEFGEINSFMNGHPITLKGKPFILNNKQTHWLSFEKLTTPFAVASYCYEFYPWILIAIAMYALSRIIKRPK